MLKSPSRTARVHHAVDGTLVAAQMLVYVVSECQYEEVRGRRFARLAIADSHDGLSGVKRGRLCVLVAHFQDTNQEGKAGCVL